MNEIFAFFDKKNGFLTVNQGVRLILYDDIDSIMLYLINVINRKVR